jgi:hypothetical protein
LAIRLLQPRDKAEGAKPRPGYRRSARPKRRAAGQYCALLARAGFLLERVVATRSPFSVIEAFPV